MELTRRDFEIMLERVENPPVSEGVIYNAIAIAPRHRLMLKETYRFLFDTNVSDEEKKYLLRPVYDIAGDPSTFFHYLFYPSQQIMNSTDRVYITRRWALELYKILRKARMHGFAFDEKLKDVRDSRKSMLRYRPNSEYGELDTDMSAAPIRPM